MSAYIFIYNLGCCGSSRKQNTVTSQYQRAGRQPPTTKLPTGVATDQLGWGVAILALDSCSMYKTYNTLYQKLRQLIVFQQQLNYTYVLKRAVGLKGD